MILEIFDFLSLTIDWFLDTIINILLYQAIFSTTLINITIKQGDIIKLIKREMAFHFLFLAYRLISLDKGHKKMKLKCTNSCLMCDR